MKLRHRFTIRGRRALILLLPIGLAFVIWALVIEPARLIVKRETLNLPAASAGALNQLKIVLLSDLHIGAPHVGLEKLRVIVARANAEQPDVVLLAGDYVIDDIIGGTRIAPEPIAAELGKLRAHYGVYAVLGNHDWWNNGARIAQALTTAGIKMLDNDALQIRRDDGQTFWLVGFGDEYTRHDQIDATLQKLNDAAPIIAFTHSPDLFPRIPNRVLLTLAGHTHGGQVALPFIGRPVTPSHYGQRYAYGLIREGAKYLYVTSGIGTSILPVRFRVPPEIVVLTIQTN